MKKSCSTCAYDGTGCVAIIGVCKDNDKRQKKIFKTCATCSYKSGSQCTLPGLDICCGYSKWSERVPKSCSTCAHESSSSPCQGPERFCEHFSKWQVASGSSSRYYRRAKKDNITALKNIAKTFGKGVKFDRDKPRYDLIPPHALEDLAKVYAFGAKKYGDRNWEKGLEYGRMYRAAIGHMNQWWLGDKADSESGMSHLTHAAFCVLGLLEYELTGRSELDNRVKSEEK